MGAVIGARYHELIREKESGHSINGEIAGKKDSIRYEDRRGLVDEKGRGNKRGNGSKSDEGNKSEMKPGMLREMRPGYVWAGFAISLALMLTEGYLTWASGLQRHNSMYLFLLPVMYFFMEALLLVEGRTKTYLRPVSMWIYLLHPLCIIVVRGGAEAINLWEILVENSLVFYFLVCISSLCAGCVLEFLRGIIQKGKAGWIKGKSKTDEQEKPDGQTGKITGSRRMPRR
jgi:hypothetical protein